MVRIPKLNANKKLQISYAVYSYFVNNNKNYIAAFMPFVVLLLKYKNVSQKVGPIQKDLLSEYGIFIPRTPLLEIITYSITKGFINTSQQKTENETITYYQLSQSGLLEANKYDDFDAINEKLEIFYEDVMKFLLGKAGKTKLSKKNSPPQSIIETREAFLDFVNRNVSPLLHYTHGKEASSIMSEAIEDFFNQSRKKNDKSLCEYTKRAKKENLEQYRLIKELIEGTLISLVYNMDTKYREYKKGGPKPDIFIDTNLLIYMLGFQFEEFTEPAKELLEILKDWGFNLNVFSITVEELTRVLFYCTTREAYYKEDVLVNSICSYFKTVGIKRNQILEIINNIKYKIDDLGINIVGASVDFNNYNPKTIEAMKAELVEFRTKKKVVSKNPTKAINHDLSVLLKIKDLRGEGPIYSFEESKAIFVTADQGLVNLNWKTHSEESTIPEIYLDRFLTELFWLKDPKSDIKVETMIATCLRDTFIHPHIWEYFIEMLNKKFAASEVDRFLTSFLSQDIIDRLYEMNPGDIGEVEKLVDSIDKFDINPSNIDFSVIKGQNEVELKIGEKKTNGKKLEEKKPVEEEPVEEEPVDEKPVDEKPVDEKPVENNNSLDSIDLDKMADKIIKYLMICLSFLTLLLLIHCLIVPNLASNIGLAISGASFILAVSALLISPVSIKNKIKELIKNRIDLKK